MAKKRLGGPAYKVWNRAIPDRNRRTERYEMFQLDDQYRVIIKAIMTREEAEALEGEPISFAQWGAATGQRFSEFEAAEANPFPFLLSPLTRRLKRLGNEAYASAEDEDDAGQSGYLNGLGLAYHESARVIDRLYPDVDAIVDALLELDRGAPAPWQHISDATAEDRGAAVGYKTAVKRSIDIVKGRGR